MAARINFTYEGAFGKALHGTLNVEDVLESQVGIAWKLPSGKATKIIPYARVIEMTIEED